MHQQCLKALWKGKKVHTNVSGCPFQQDEVALIRDGLSVDELAEDWEIVPNHLKVSLPEWEDLEEPKSNLEEIAPNTPVLIDLEAVEIWWEEQMSSGREFI